MKNSVVIITGAASMIGKATAHLFLQHHAKLVLISHSLKKLECFADELKSDVNIHAIDIGDPIMVEEVISQTKKQFQRIDCVVQNTAIYPYQSIETLDILSWNNTLQTTLTGPFLMTKYCVDIMKKQQQGKIIFLSSIAGEILGLPNMSAYAAAKAGLNGLMRTAAIELAKYNINVNSISPGKMYDADTLTQQERLEKLRSVPLQRFIQPNDIAEMILFLASNKANNITGQNFIIDGGQSILAQESHLL